MPKRGSGTNLARRSWRVSTAVRVFALAVAAGQGLGGEVLTSVWVVLVTLITLAGVLCVLELDPRIISNPWTTVVEAVLVSVLIGSAVGGAAPLAVYLVVPTLVAGLRHGWVATVNTWLVSGLATGGALATATGFDVPGPTVGTLSTWLVLALGAGLLTAWQTRSVRAVEAAQAPYSAAHHVVSQLHDLTRKLQVGLDSPAVAQRITAQFNGDRRVERSAVLIPTGGGTGLEVLASRGSLSIVDREIAESCASEGRTRTSGGSAAVPLCVGDHSVGVLLLGRQPSWSRQELVELRALADVEAVRLDTAVLFDDVRTSATTEERNRLARDIHDGIAQEIVSLGYLAEEIAATTSDPGTVRIADDLRAEINRVVSELRFSIFDLRHDMTESGSLSGSLAEYVREVSHRGSFRVHLTLDERGPRLPQRVEQELLRIAQEAIGNVRKHARAINLWITLTNDGDQMRLVVEDDGIGGASAKEGHYGLHTMRERAERIDAEFSVASRPDGGTVVTVRSDCTGEHREEHRHDDKNPARR